MKKKLLCAATIGAFAPASLMAQALAPNQGPMALIYYEVPLGVAQSRETQATFGLRVLANKNQGTEIGRGGVLPPLADFRFNPKGFESFSLRNSVVFRQAEAGKPADAPVNWWIVGGVLVGAAVVIHHENKKDNQTQTTTPPACFTSETRVVMADGSFKSICEIELGDEVQSWNFEVARVATNRVTRLHRFDADGFLRVNGLEVTGKHPFAVGKNVWLEAEDLRASDQLVGRDPVQRIEIAHMARVGEAAPVFDLTVAEDHNFFVAGSAGAVLVHNKGGGACFIAGSGVAMADGTQRVIEAIAAGERVKAFDLEANAWTDAEVTEAQAFRQASLGYYVVNQHLRVSPVHQLAVNGRWKSAPELQPGDWLTDFGANRVPVTSVRYVEEKADRHNLVLGRNPRLLYAVNGLMVWNGW